jgi:hypothetical protein
MKKVYTTTDCVKIKNANGTADRECECGSWLEHWENFSGQTATKCAVSGCDNIATDGAHVTRPIAKNDDYKTHSYIVPMCKSHNGQHGAEFDTKENTTFVWANVSKTCGT